MAFDPVAVRAQFPLLSSREDLAYLDCAATAQKPRAVIDAVRTFWERDNANVHRSQHPLSEAATAAYEGARETVRAFLNARDAREIVVTRGTTEGINLVARSYGSLLRAGDRVLVTRLEHHSNILPWMLLSSPGGVRIGWIDVGPDGLPGIAALERELARGDVRLVAVTGQSNVLGTRPDLRRIADLAHAAGAVVLVDAAQLIVHGSVDVRGLDCDFLAFSGHKLYGPDGIGVLYGKQELLEAMPPFLGGGMMLEDVRDDGFVPAEVPARFEAGTLSASGFVGLAAAIRWLDGIPAADRVAHERMLVDLLHALLRAIPGVRVLGPEDPALTHGCVSFVVDGAHPHDIAHLLGQEGVCVRAGHHCAKPLHAALGVPASVRVSVGVHTSPGEIERLPEAIARARRTLQA